MFDVNDFCEFPEVANIFESAMFKDDYTIIKMLELYKFCTREKIISVLSKKYHLEDLVSIESCDWREELQFVMTKYHVFIEVVSDTKAIIYTCLFRELDINGLAIDLASFTLDIKYITPLNYEILSGVDITKSYDSLILFKRILLQAIKLQATDLHFSVKHKDMIPLYPIEYRKDGSLYTMNLFTLDANLNSSIVHSLIAHKTKVSDLDLLSAAGVIANSSNIFQTNDVELRITACKVKDGYHCVIRIQEAKTFSFTLDKLGFPEIILHDLDYCVNKKNGLILFTGAVRTGKNTSAFALINEIIKQPVNVVSYESPIEVLMPINQIDYYGNEDTLLNAVRLAKKQDVDLAFLNEIPNKEVAFAVKDLLNSSIGVITTMHLNRIWHLGYKLYEYYGDSYKDVISQIVAVFNQKMFPIGCPHCQEEYYVSTSDLACKEILLKNNITSVKQSVGCSKCNHGLLDGGNQPYSESIIFTEELKDELLKCDAPYQMEKILKNEILSSNKSLEHQMILAVKEGKLMSNCLWDL